MRVSRVLAFWMAGAALFGATEIPIITPQVTSIFPHGGQHGSKGEVAVEIRGSYLSDASRIEFPGGQIQAAIEASSFREVRTRLRIAPGAEVACTSSA